MTMGRMVIVCAILAVTVWLVRAAQISERPADCEPCDPGTCAPLTEPCEAGELVDRCGCCKICAQKEHELCDHPDVKNKDGVHHGRCGDNLECRIREDLAKDKKKPRMEAECACTIPGALCGRNNVTYSSMCELLADGIKSGKQITVDYKGPCVSAPTITSPPENVVAKVGENYALSCEAKGVPIPTIEWTFTRADQTTLYLPSDDLHVAINTRGGPELYEVTGWVQVMDIQKDMHEGDYTCIAQNEHGVVQKTGRINVDDPDFKKPIVKDEN